MKPFSCGFEKPHQLLIPHAYFQSISKIGDHVDNRYQGNLVHSLVANEHLPGHISIYNRGSHSSTMCDLELLQPAQHTSHSFLTAFLKLKEYSKHQTRIFHSSSLSTDIFHSILLLSWLQPVLPHQWFWFSLSVPYTYFLPRIPIINYLWDIPSLMSHRILTVKGTKGTSFRSDLSFCISCVIGTTFHPNKKPM